MHSEAFVEGVGLERSHLGLSKDKLLRLEQVKEMVGLGKTLIYRLISAGDFPSPYKPGGSAARWSENEVLRWLNACAAQRVVH